MMDDELAEAFEDLKRAREEQRERRRKHANGGDMEDAITPPPQQPPRPPPPGAQPEPISSDKWAQLTRQPDPEYRDEAATKIVGHLFRHNCDYELVLGMLLAWNTACCMPPLDYDELKDVVDRIALREANRIKAQLKRDRGE